MCMQVLNGEKLKEVRNLKKLKQKDIASAYHKAFF